MKITWHCRKILSLFGQPIWIKSWNNVSLHKHDNDIFSHSSLIKTYLESVEWVQLQFPLALFTCLDFRHIVMYLDFLFIFCLFCFSNYHWYHCQHGALIKKSNKPTLSIIINGLFFNTDLQWKILIHMHFCCSSHWIDFLSSSLTPRHGDIGCIKLLSTLAITFPITSIYSTLPHLKVPLNLFGCAPSTTSSKQTALLFQPRSGSSVHSRSLFFFISSTLSPLYHCEPLG